MALKLPGSQWVRPIFRALAVPLLLLLWLWHAAPKFVSNVGKLIQTMNASPEIGSWVQDIEKNYQFFVFLFSMFVVCMGLTRWLGKRLWYQEKLSRRKELKLPVATLFSSDTSSFTYLTLFQGGFIGLGLVSWFLLSVIVFPSGDEDVLQLLPLTMFFPIFMLGAISIQILLENAFARENLDVLTNSPVLVIRTTFLVAIIVSCAVVELVFLLKSQTSATLTVQIMITVVVSWCYSYTIGLREGLKAADPESTYPLVSIEVIQGTGFEQAWLYERTDSDYRIVTKSGSNYIIPASNVKEIRDIRSLPASVE
jgi:hypothetical protein